MHAAQQDNDSKGVSVSVRRETIQNSDCPKRDSESAICKYDEFFFLCHLIHCEFPNRVAWLIFS